jgi:hypothetical protein
VVKFVLAMHEPRVRFTAATSFCTLYFHFAPPSNHASAEVKTTNSFAKAYGCKASFFLTTCDLSCQASSALDNICVFESQISSSVL